MKKQTDDPVIHSIHMGSPRHLSTVLIWHPWLQALPRDIQSPFGTWPVQSLEELQLEALPADLLHALSHGRGGLPDLDVSPDELRWALAVRPNPNAPTQIQ